MKQIIGKIKSLGLHRIVIVFLATLLFIALPAFQASAVQSATGEYNPVTPDTVKRIQEKAEDLGDAPGRRIGDTGLHQNAAEKDSRSSRSKSQANQSHI